MKTFYTAETPAGRLALARKAAGFKSAAAAAKRLQVSDATYRSHENGERGYSLETAIIYARMFNCDAHYLKHGKGEAPSSDDLRLSRTATLAMLAEGVKIARMTPLEADYLAELILEALLEFAGETDITNPAQFARLWLGSLAKRSAAQ